MLRSIRSVVLILSAIFAAYILQRISERPSLVQQVQGRNNTALFIINELSGLHNVHMATIQSLRMNHPQVEVHVASWPGVEAKLKRISDKAYFHGLKSQGYLEAVLAISGTTEITDGIMGPGLSGISKFTAFMQIWMSPWSNEEHFALIEETGKLMDTIDPAVVVLDTFMWPAISAAREKNRLHAFIVPNMLADSFPHAQWWAKGFWKYPALGSPSEFPIPLASKLAEIWYAIRVRYVLSWTPNLRSKKAYLKKRGIRSKSMDFYGLYRPDTPWITQTLPEASIPVDYIPPNVTCTGPITVNVALATEQDEKMAHWLAQLPTVLVNLGNTVSLLLDENPRLQVLWKYQRAGNYSEDTFRKIAEKHVVDGRFRIVSWLEIDPFAILETGHVIAFVHHGGAGSYHEGLAAGVPHVVLPLWVDHYNIAVLVERLNIGIWGCRASSPQWTAECLHGSIASLVEANENTKRIRKNADKLAEISRASPGRDGAARIVARFADSSYTSS
ncbi:UDP-Glycosyltransferase/glycogen phosphorylase [Lojkania enalia]|uniref:UDP-Glycosyltransferase/glycogen phosphorylase n=1 Tax=Lojkania enalia TaxID=147567 RepID=A0A9P4K2C3_9PLEO|nr:UDP-Glycosyltransferase/glycogen phosphorylase [Didymosphaeria enalia]